MTNVGGADRPALQHWSASRFMTWELCPKEFEKVYVLGERPEPTEAMLFGSAVHQGLEAHFNGADGVAAFRGIWKMMRDDHLQQVGGGDPKLTSVGMDLIDLVRDQGWSGTPEYVFTIDTKPAWGLVTVGAVDLISQGLGPSEEITVRDFKTTTGAWGWERARRDPWQPALYAMAVVEKYGIWPSFEYVVLNKKSRDLTVFHFDQDEVWAMGEDMEERARSIVARCQAGLFECSGKHGDCLECGARWTHDHVCDLTAQPPRIRIRERDPLEYVVGSRR